MLDVHIIVWPSRIAADRAAKMVIPDVAPAYIVRSRKVDAIGSIVQAENVGVINHIVLNPYIRGIEADAWTAVGPTRDCEAVKFDVLAAARQCGLVVKHRHVVRNSSAKEEERLLRPA